MTSVRLLFCSPIGAKEGPTFSSFTTLSAVKTSNFGANFFSI